MTIEGVRGKKVKRRSRKRKAEGQGGDREDMLGCTMHRSLVGIPENTKCGEEVGEDRIRDKEWKERRGNEGERRRKDREKGKKRKVSGPGQIFVNADC